jgi:hypothetical protein
MKTNKNVKIAFFFLASISILAPTLYNNYSKKQLKFNAFMSSLQQNKRLINEP